MASPGRFELPAPRLGGVCSIQLSYGDIFDFSWSRMERSASQDFDDLIIRRRTLYPAELRAHTTPGISANEYARHVVPVVGLEPTRCCHQRILSPHRLPFRHTGVRIAFILYYAAFVKSSVFCPQNAKKTISGLFSARRRAGLCRRGALPVSAAQKDSRRGLPVPAAQRDSRRALPVSAVQRDSRRGLPQQASHC